MMRHTNQGKRQQGLSTVGIIAVVGIFGLLVVTFFKVFPMYYDNFKLTSVLEAIENDSALDPKSKKAIWESLQKRLYINEVRSITRDHVKMVRKNGKTTITVTYEVRDNFIGNLFIGASFEESAVINR
ncbi:MAG TPA: DUF4845 domain-containing protein [Gammaproteobacteria bacterium]|nr:DUF4845 domain-containing protein [Gammaproteobacteria bacterium]